MSEELKPCPFCGGLNIKPEEFVVSYIFCLDCGAMGPTVIAKRHSKKEAIALWNKREESPLKNVAESGENSDRKQST